MTKSETLLIDSIVQNRGETLVNTFQLFIVGSLSSLSDGWLRSRKHWSGHPHQTEVPAKRVISLTDTKSIFIFENRRRFLWVKTLLSNPQVDGCLNSNWRSDVATITRHLPNHLPVMMISVDTKHSFYFRNAASKIIRSFVMPRQFGTFYCL